MAPHEHPGTGDGHSTATRDVPRVEVEPPGKGAARLDNRQRQLARSAVRAMALRTGRSEAEVVSAFGATVLSTAAVDLLRAVDFVFELRPVHRHHPTTRT